QGRPSATNAKDAKGYLPVSHVYLPDTLSRKVDVQQDTPNTQETPRRPRYPSPSAIVHIVLRTAGILINIVFLIFLARLTEIYRETYPVAYTAAGWALCADVPEVVVLLNKSRSIPRLSGGGQLTLDLIDLLLLIPAAVLNWVSSSPPPGGYKHPPAVDEANEWLGNVVWIGCACLSGIRLILSVAVCVDFCLARRRRQG
ncbi:hypothetical protein GB937_009431, partial [Aspergillus fischeri]